MKTPMKVLELKTELEKEEAGHEVFVRDRAGELFRYPIIRVEMRVGVSEPIGWSEPTHEAAVRAAKLFLGVKRQPWWKRWWRSEAEKMRGWRWRVRS